MISKNEFGDIYERYFDKLYKFIFFRVNDTVVAEDLVSQVFFKALRNIESFDPSRGKVSTWLYAITSNLLIDHYKKSEQNERLDEYENYLFIENDVSDDLDREMDMTRATDILRKLPLKAQQIISLRIYEEMSFVDISKVIGISESGAKMAFMRGIENIRNSLMTLLLIIFSLFK